MTEPIAYLTVGLFAVGMAVSFLLADPRSPTSRPLAVLFALLGVTFAMNIPANAGVLLSRPAWIRVFSMLEAGILVSSFEWILRIARTEVGPAAERTTGERLLRVAQGLAIVYGLAGVLLPGVRIASWNSGWSWSSLRDPGFHLFAIPFWASLAVAGIRVLALLRTEIDPTEWVRLNGLFLATPFWCLGLVVPVAWKPVGFAIGETLFLIGAIRYHVLQGRRGQFLSRFVSPQLTRLVQERGLTSIMQRSRIELSVVACDLRGFTSFAETAAPEDVMRLLEEYYAAVGDAVGRFGGSITSFAGDGMVALVGAPVAAPDHAERAVSMALGIRDRTIQVLHGWRKIGLDVGVGLGIASGFVTVGVIGGSERLEYTAIGPPVNLAARLCGRAAAGQILADARTAGAAGDGGHPFAFEKLEPVELKGLARPVAVFAVTERPAAELG